MITLDERKPHKQCILGDENVERKTQAEVLLNTYSRELDRRRLSAGAQGLLISGDGMYFIFRRRFRLT